MRTLVDLPRVPCKLGFCDGTTDIAMFQDCAKGVSWTNDEINVAVVKAVYGSSNFDDVGLSLQQYCTSDSDAEA